MERVVITGTGVVSSIGIGSDNFLNSLKKGICGIKTIDVESISVPAALVEINGKSKINFKGYKIASIALEEAAADANITIEQLQTLKVGIVTGTMNSTTNDILDRYNNIKNGEYNRADKFAVSSYGFNSVTDYLYRKYRLQGERITVSNSCATGICIIEQAKQLIQNGYCDVCLAVGVDLVNLVGLIPMKVLRIIEDTTLRPFDKNRKGTVQGEGAGVLVLESQKFAQERKATIKGEVLGISIKNDIFESIFSSSEDGKAIIKSMEEALKLSNIPLESIDYINAHGTGTQQNDLIETNAIKAVFGERAYDIPISSTKSFIGHTGAAAGILEIIASLYAITADFVHPTLNYSEKDPLCDLNYVPNNYINKKVNYFMKNSIGFGGVNSSIVISKYFGGQNE